MKGDKNENENESIYGSINEGINGSWDYFTLFFWISSLCNSKHVLRF